MINWIAKKLNLKFFVVIALVAILVVAFTFKQVNDYLNKQARSYKTETSLKLSSTHAKPKITKEGSLLSYKYKDFQATLGTDVSRVATIKFGQKEIRFIVLNTNSSVAKVEDTRAVYKNIYKNTDLHRVVTSKGIKNNYILKKSGHPQVFAERISTDLTLKMMATGALGYYDGKKLIATSPRPFLLDAKKVKKNLSYSLAGSTLAIKLPSLEGLKYPIIVDPSILEATPPAVPSNVSIGEVTSNSAQVSWSDNSDNEQGFKVERSSNGVNFSQVATVGTGTTSYLDTSLSNNTRYWYRVAAYNESGSTISPPSAPKYTLAAAPSNVSVSSGEVGGQAYLNMQWQDTFPLASSYNIYSDKKADGTDDNYNTAISTLTNSYLWSNLAEYTSFNLRIYSVNGDGVQSSGYAEGAGYTYPGSDLKTFVVPNPSRPDAYNGWYRTVPTVSLFTSKPATTYYKWDSLDAEWITYSGSFGGPQSGEHTLYYYSIQGSETEPVRAYRIKVDTSIPPVSYGGSCEACHGAGAGSFANGDHVTWYNNTPHDVELAGPPDKCRRCHTEQMDLTKPKSLRDSVLGVDSQWHEVTGNNNTLCFACHTGADSSGIYEGKSMFEQTTHARVRTSGKALPRYPDAGFDSGMCGNCHNPHGVEGATKYLRAAGSQLCKNCHDDQKLPPKPSDYFYRGAAVYDASQHKIASVDCTKCHNPHGKNDSTGKPIAKLTKDKEEALCFTSTCHDSASSSVNGINILQRFNAFSGGDTQAVMSSRHDVYAADQLVSGARIECVNCHNPHSNNREYKTVDPDDRSVLFKPPEEPAYAGGIKRFEETNSAITYVGTWQLTSSGSFSGGKAKYNNSGSTSSASATLTFEGTAVTWYSKVGNNMGIVNVYIDGIFQQQVDLYYYTTLLYPSPYPVYSKSGLSVGTHTLKVQVTGTKNPLSTSYYVYVDAFDVTLPPLEVADYIGFCNKCHDNSPPAGVVMSGPMNISSAYTGDYHGEAAGTGASSTLALKAPFARGAGPLSCHLCHDPHGSSSVFHFNEKVNNYSVSSITNMNGQGAYSLCSSCHQAPNNTPDDFHRVCLDCHATQGHGLGAPSTFEGKNCFDCHKHGRRNFTPYPNGDDPATCEMGSCHPTYQSTF